MKHGLRMASSVLQCALMLAVVGVLAAATALAVVTALVVAVMAGGAWAQGAGVAAVMAVATGAALFLARRRRRDPLVGVPITSYEHPLLWVEIQRVAEGLGTRPPDELWLVPSAMVAASEHGTCLGLRQGSRSLRLGLPLLVGLSERQLRAVITHELCRRWGPARTGRIIQRGKEIIGRVLDPLSEDSTAGRTFRHYGDAFTAASGPLALNHELDADRLSAALAGNDATSAALRELAVLSGGWDAFVKGYTQPARAVGRRPQDLFAGFACFLEDADRRAQLTKETIAAKPLSAYGSRLSLGERLAAIASLPDDGLLDRSGPAIYLLRDPGRVVSRLEESMFLESGFMSGTWEEILPEVGRAAACEDALRLARLGHEGGLGPTLSVAALLEIINLRLADEMVRPLLAKGTSQEDERQMAGRLVTGFLATAAIESGTLSYRFSWATPSVLVDDRGEVDDLPRVIDSALADQSAVPALELWLETHRVSPELELGADVEEADPPEDPRPSLVPVSGSAST